jgi:hypothetical protein
MQGLMKIVAAYFAGIATAVMLAAGAATLTITTDASQDTRIAPAFGAKLNLGRNATGAEVKADLIAYLRRVVYEYEQQRRTITTEGLDPS